MLNTNRSRCDDQVPCTCKQSHHEAASLHLRSMYENTFLFLPHLLHQVRKSDSVRGAAYLQGEDSTKNNGIDNQNQPAMCSKYQPERCLHYHNRAESTRKSIATKHSQWKRV